LAGQGLEVSERVEKFRGKLFSSKVQDGDARGWRTLFMATQTKISSGRVGNESGWHEFPEDAGPNGAKDFSLVG
jgi:hypothetical protein